MQWNLCLVTNHRISLTSESYFQITMKKKKSLKKKDMTTNLMMHRVWGERALVAEGEVCHLYLYLRAGSPSL